MTQTATIMIVEDEVVNATLLDYQLAKLGYAVAGITSTGEEAILMAEKKRPDLVLMDIGLAGALDGVDTAKIIRARWGLPVIYLTASSDDNTIDRARDTDAHGYLHKPFNARELHSTLQIALQKASLEARIREEKKWLSTTLRCIHDAVIAADATGLVKLMNTAAERLTGWQESDAVSCDLSEVFRVLEPSTREPAECEVVRALRNEASGAASRQLLVSRQGVETLIEESAAPIENEAGAMIGVVLVFRSVGALPV